MNRIFRPEPEASAELEDAAVWYNSQRPGLGVEFVEAVDAALDQIARWPQVGRTVPGVPNDVPVRRFPVDDFHTTSPIWNGMARFACLPSRMIDVGPVIGSLAFDSVSSTSRFSRGALVP